MQDSPVDTTPGNKARRRRPWHAPKLLVEDDVAQATGIIFGPKNYNNEPANSTPRLPTS